MKKLVFILAISLVSIVLSGQNISKLRAIDYCYQLKSEYSGNWQEWTAWQKCNYVIVIDINKLRINIYTKDHQEFDIIETYDITNTTIEFRAIDQNGVYCGIRFVEKSTESHLYIDYSNYREAYNVIDLN